MNLSILQNGGLICRICPEHEEPLHDSLDMNGKGAGKLHKLASRVTMN